MQSQCRFFFFQGTATTKIYTLSLHDALPILRAHLQEQTFGVLPKLDQSLKGTLLEHLSKSKLLSGGTRIVLRKDRKSTRLNSSHSQISYAVFCLKKKIIFSIVDQES